MKATLRIKKRYIAFRVVGPEKDMLSDSEVRNGIYEPLLRFFGELGLSTLNFRFIRYDHRKKTGLLSCERGGVPMLQAALALVNDICGKKARIMATGTSGTILSLKEKGI